ncbi:MAG: cyclic nucleotide-binding domain-containing protein [Rudaea sp.]
MSNAKDFFIDVPPGTDVFKEGDIGGEMYIVETGLVELVDRDGDTVAKIGPGEFFGEAAIDGKPHASGAVGIGKTRLLRIERGAFSDVAKQNPEIAVRVLKQVVARYLQKSAAAQKPKPAKVEQAKPEPAKSEAPKPEIAKKPEPVAAPAPPAPPPVPVSPPKQKALALRAAGSEQAIALDVSLNEFLIGRPDPASGIDPEVDLGPFDANRTLSRRHAKILREGSLYFLREENGVANGTFLNGERIQTGNKVPIKPGDKLRFGLIDVDVISV